jgi:hypothetical protein
VRQPFDLRAPAALIWLEAGLDPHPGLFDDSTNAGRYSLEFWDHFWVALSYAMNIDWHDQRVPWMRVAGRVLGPTALREICWDWTGEEI